MWILRRACPGSATWVLNPSERGGHGQIGAEGATQPGPPSSQGGRRCGHRCQHNEGTGCCAQLPGNQHRGQGPRAEHPLRLRSDHCRHSGSPAPPTRQLSMAPRKDALVLGSETVVGAGRHTRAHTHTSREITPMLAPGTYGAGHQELFIRCPSPTAPLLLFQN